MKTSTTASRTEIAVVLSAALAQGLALVTFPAASSIFTGAAGFGFNSTRYGMMFTPQVVLAILSSSLAPTLASRWSLRRVLLAGLAADIFSMSLLALSRLLIGDAVHDDDRDAIGDAHRLIGPAPTEPPLLGIPLLRAVLGFLPPRGRPTAMSRDFPVNRASAVLTMVGPAEYSV